jgi:hypothetical protein
MTDFCMKLLFKVGHAEQGEAAVEGSAPREVSSGEKSLRCGSGSAPGADPSTAPAGSAQDDGMLK